MSKAWDGSILSIISFYAPDMVYTVVDSVLECELVGLGCNNCDLEELYFVKFTVF